MSCADGGNTTGTKGCAFRILLNPPCAGKLFERQSLSGLLLCAGVGMERERKAAPFGSHWNVLRGQRQGGHLRPKSSLRGPWPDGINHSLSVQSKLIVQLMSIARTVFVQPKHAKKSLRDVFRPRGSDQNAHIHGRAFVQLKNRLRLRAHTKIQTHMPPEPYDRKSFGLYQ